MGNEKKPKRFPLGQAVSEGIIANETLAYFIGRTYLFAQRVRRMEPAARARARRACCPAAALHALPVWPILPEKGACCWQPCATNRLPLCPFPSPCPQIGLNPDRVRFRQHLQHEMAHYAEDCWDFEVECRWG